MKKITKVTPLCAERGINGISVSSNNKHIYVCHHSKESTKQSQHYSKIYQYAMYWTPSKILVLFLQAPWGRLW